MSSEAPQRAFKILAKRRHALVSFFQVDPVYVHIARLWERGSRRRYALQCDMELDFWDTKVPFVADDCSQEETNLDLEMYGLSQRPRQELLALTISTRGLFGELVATFSPSTLAARVGASRKSFVTEDRTGWGRWLSLVAQVRPLTESGQEVQECAFPERDSPTLRL